MVDWMIEVCTSFRCTERTWFLAVALFDKYLHLMKGRKCLKNTDVHGLGISAMYLASKYEDVYPINSMIAHEKISHKAISQKDILNGEAEFILAFDFQLDLVTSFDFHQYFMGILKHRFSFPEHKELISKVEELSLYLLRMTLENVDLIRYEHSTLASAAIYSAISLLKRSPLHGNTASEKIFAEMS
jgi:cyclin A